MGCPPVGTGRMAFRYSTQEASHGEPAYQFSPECRTLSQERAKPTAGAGRRKKRRPAAERQGESITRRIAPRGATRKGADVRLAIYPKAVVKELQPGGKVRCS